MNRLYCIATEAFMSVISQMRYSVIVRIRLCIANMQQRRNRPFEKIGRSECMTYDNNLLQPCDCV